MYEHPETATVLDNLANLYCDQNRYKEAEPLYLQVLNIRQQILDSEHPETVTTLDSLARVSSAQGKDEQTKPLLRIY
jgi:tetratricopeptide (TPR) repeat protein